MTDLHQEWEEVFNDELNADFVSRMRVPGGWLYRNMLPADKDQNEPTVTMVFVPDKER